MPNQSPNLVYQASRAAFWNAASLPLLTLLGLGFSVVIRRRFGLFSGVYDIVLGLVATLSLYSGLGIPTSLTKLLPEMEVRSGARAVVQLVRRAAALRVLALVVALVPLNLFADEVASRLDLGDDGPLYVHLLSVLVMARVLVELATKILNAFFAQLWSNLLALGQDALNFSLVGLILLVGYDMAGVLGALAVSSATIAVVGSGCVRRVLGRLPRHATTGAQQSGAIAGENRRFLGFTFFTYVSELGPYFAGMAFAGPALAVVLDREQVALFATASKLSFMTVTLAVGVFRGLYRPIFARLRSRDDATQLRRAFTALSQAQLLVLMPAGVGLAVMAGDYVPLLFGSAFSPAVPIAWILIPCMYGETAFNLGLIVLSVDERYRAVLSTQLIAVVAAPFFLVIAAQGGLLWAAVIFGGARFAAAFVGYLLCRRAYGFRFPWRFAGRVAALSAIMAAVLLIAKLYWEPSPARAVVLTLAGALVFIVGLRAARVLGPEEADLLRRAKFPGHQWLTRWLS